VFHCFLEVDLVSAVVDVFFEDFLEDVGEVAEELAEVSGEEGASHVESFFALVVTVVFLD